MSEAGFDAHEVGTLAGVGAQGQAAGNQGGSSSGGGGGGGGSESSTESTDYDAMDLNEDGIVTFAEMQEYYGNSSDDSSDTLSQNQQNTLDNLQLLMETLKSNGESDPTNSNSFDGLLKAINNQNSNSNLNIYLQSSNATSSLFGYA